MFSDLSKAIGQSFDPAFRRVFFKSFVAALLVFIVLGWGFWFLVDWGGRAALTDMAGWGLGETWTSSLEWIISALGVITFLGTCFVLFPAVMITVMSFLLEEIAAAVEAKHYPELAPARSQPISEAIGDGIKFLAVTLVVNLLVLPLYLILLFVPPLNFVLFYLVNGYLLGREYFELVAVRRLSSQEAKRLRRGARGKVFAAGVVIAVLVTLPLVNLVTPIISTGFMLHVFERLRRARGNMGEQAA